jgi:putative hydrolase of the HAD superfamily
VEKEGELKVKSESNKATMTETNIKALVFDIGGVLFLPKENGREKHLLSSFRETCFLLQEDGVDTSQVQETLYDIYKKSSKGEISKEETLNLMSSELDVLPDTVEKLFEKAYRNNTIENTELYEFILKLKKSGYKIGVLTTQSHLSTNVLVPEKYRNNFDALEISCEDGVKKPDEEAFKLIIKRLAISSEESVFVDDKQENLDAAEKVKMKTALFENNKQLVSRFKELGIF